VATVTITRITAAFVSKWTQT